MLNPAAPSPCPKAKPRIFVCRDAEKESESGGKNSETSNKKGLLIPTSGCRKQNLKKSDALFLCLFICTHNLWECNFVLIYFSLTSSLRLDATQATESGQQ
jgi:hypothetical protein